MNMTTKQEILKDKLADYLSADKAGKGHLLDHLTTVTGMNRFAVIRRLNELAARGPYWESKHRGRKEVYDGRVTVALKEVWELSGCICAERLHPHIPEYVSVLQRLKDWSYAPDTTKLLLDMSLGTVKDRLEVFPRIKRGGKSATKPSMLKELVPIRLGPWNNPDPGFGEVDTVAHCGTSLIGDYAYSLQYTDVATIWTLLCGQWNKGMKATTESLKTIERRCPFKLKGFDFDSGTEFINDQVVTWCINQNIQTTRTRPYRKNDHGRIEQKNYANVRHFVGYFRYDQPEQVKLLNQLYLILEDYLNFFVPSMKSVSKQRIGSKYVRKYDTAKTAYQRVLSHPGIPDGVKQQLQIKYVTLNPKQLKFRIEQLQQKLLITVRRKQLTYKLQ